MFRSRRSSQSNAAARNTPTTAAAATAAAQAFLANRASNASLSSAAAAAALRTHKAPPTPVSEVQTKRTQRRGSVSSNGSAAGGPGTLRRQGSSGSMTERSFREQSPSRPPSRAEKPPPMPALPRNYAKQTSNNKLVRRPSSAEPPQRVMSPVPNKQAGRGVSLDRSGSIPKSQPPPLPTTPQLPKIDTGNETPQSGGRASVNFSRPMSPVSPTGPPRSPPSQKPKPQNQGKIISPADVDNIDNSLQNAATRPVKKKKKKTAPTVTEGSHLSIGHSAARPTGTAVNGETTKATAPRKDDFPNNAAKGELDSARPERSTVPASPTRATASSEAADKNSRTSGRLTKQPSIVREDLEGEELEERQAQVAATRVDDLQEPGQIFPEPLEANETIQLSNAQFVPSPELASSIGDVAKVSEQSPSASSILQPESFTKEQKRLSISPSRSAHFSAQPVLDLPGMLRHEPLARAASPAKSALKRSPSPRIPSPSGLALTEVSDTMSVGSEEGLGSGRKRRNVRVSFDDQPLIVGESADPPSNANSPILFSPQNKDPSKRPLFGFRRDRLDEIENDDGMSPVPKLPSFGSIRGRKEPQEKAGTEALNSGQRGSEQGSDSLRDLTSSSDHALGAVLAQDAASTARRISQSDPNEPLPPEVTSVEGSGYHSDSESSDDGANGDLLQKSTEVLEAPPESLIQMPSQTTEALPTIAVQPATPGQDSIRENRDSWLVSMPGSFPPGDVTPAESDVDKAAPIELPTLAQVEAASEPATERQRIEAPATGEVAEITGLPQAADDAESDDTGDSIYSDAAEDSADLEGDGFGSINAIVDSPIVAPASPTLAKLTEPPGLEESPTSAKRTGTDEMWESTRTFWSGVKQGTKTDGAKESDSPTLTTESTVDKVETGPFKEGPGATSKPPVAKPVSPPPKSKLREVPDSPMRKTMRKSGPSSQVESAVPLRYPVITSGRQNAEASQLPKTMRKGPSSPVAPSGAQPQGSKEPGKKRLANPQPAKTMRTGRNTLENGATKGPSAATSAQSPSSTAQPRPRRMRALSNDSDSDSSFKRARRNPANESGRYTMRRSMRAGAPDGRPQSASFSSASTAGDPARTSLRQRPMSTTGMGMRSTLRGASLDAPSSSQTKSFGLGKGAKRPQIKSRKFSNSSDEGGPRTFTSRFADSSDEDEPASNLPFGLTPVRGIPKRIDEGDSTDLEDSDEDRKRPKHASILTVQPTPTITHGTEGSALASGSLRNKSINADKNKTSILGSPKKAEPERRRSIFGALGRRKDKAKFKPDIESAARRDTPLERTRVERSIVRQSDDLQTDIPPIPPMSPSPRGKLQRRVTPQQGTGAWPTPPPIPESPTSIRSNQRPRTSDGSVTARPNVGKRTFSTNTNPVDNAVLGRTGKKKRFPMLRKAFGLHD